MPARRRLLLAVALVAVLAPLAGRATLAAFSANTGNPSDSFSAAADWVAPTVSATVVSKTPGYRAGHVKQGGTYYVYANVSDTGNPASGVGSVTADLSAITTGATAVALVAGSYTAEGTSYGYRSASRVADNPLAAGSKSYSITSTDVAGNDRTEPGFSVTVDNTAPTASDVQTANGGATVGKPELADTVTYTFSEPIDPQAILAGWTGSSTNVVVRINNTNPDTVRIYNAGNTTQLPFGVVSLGGNYMGTNRTFGATGTPSTMVMSGPMITVTLGTPSGSTLTETTPGTMTWTPTTTPYDRAGNGMSGAAVNESGALDREF